MPRQSFSDLRCAPARLLLLGAHNQLLDLERKLIGVPVRTSRAIRQSFQSTGIIAADDLVAGLAGDAELAAQRRYFLAIQNPRIEFETLSLHSCQGTFALLAKAKSVTHVSGMSCHPSLGKDIASGYPFLHRRMVG
ncbi:hypothetical protein GGE66_002076 [Rhizobium leguminosarum]|uniref:Uncharacterized protein n=1 Tax=Rhizobium leguminosarum TaxID=384 RepID=A0A7W9ZQS6_RHILE|nr:hypothetical protein [Rhizobium leguminosarum]MBB6221106.1 hypothetical protein [Rhizobium leguminosarum]